MSSDVYKVWVGEKKKVDSGLYEVRWRVYRSAADRPIEKRKRFFDKGASDRADVFRRRLHNAEVGLPQNGQRWGFDADLQPILIDPEPRTTDTVFELMWSWRSATWRLHAPYTRRNACRSLRTMARVLVDVDQRSVPDSGDAYLQAVAFRCEREPSEDELRTEWADPDGLIVQKWKRSTYRWPVDEVIAGGRWLAEHSLRTDAVTREHLRALIHEYGRGRKASSELRYWTTARSVLVWGSNEKLNGRPRFDASLLPKLGVRTVPKPSVQHVSAVPTIEEMWTMAWAVGLAVGPDWCALPLVLGGAGLRIGEASGLQRQDCRDAANGGMWLRVNKSISDAGKDWTDTGERFQMRGTKAKGTTGDTAGRTTYLPPAESAILRQHLDLFVDRHPTAHVFTGGRGGFLTAEHVERDVWNPARKLAFSTGHRLAGLHSHSFRHLAATRWLRSGMALTNAARWGGWKDTATMVGFYDSVLPNDDEQSADLMASESGMPNRGAVHTAPRSAA